MENKQNQNHTENGTNTGQNQNTISSMFWENFDNVDTKAELENSLADLAGQSSQSVFNDKLIAEGGQIYAAAEKNG